MSDNKAQVTAQEQHAALGLSVEKTSVHTEHPEAQWFANAGLGLFVHFGIASVHGDVDLSWGMVANTGYDKAANGRNKLAPDDYWRLADFFHPEKYNPDKWLKAASEAGFQYAVLTTMHHDGYTLWPSEYSEIGVHSHWDGRDLVAPFVEACRKYGLKVGLYLSPPDWYFDRQYMNFNRRFGAPNSPDGSLAFNTKHEFAVIPPKPPGHDARRREFFHGRVRELLTRYGKIDLLWFDGGTQDNDIRDMARDLQPHIVINSRSCDGDFDCTECSLPSEKFDNWFETCHCWQSSGLAGTVGSSVDFWGYLKEETYKSTGWMLDALANLRAWGGDLLVNVGPRPDGELPDVVYARFAELAEWMAYGKPSVIGTHSGGYPETCNVPTTIGDDGTIYLHALPDFEGEILLDNTPQPKSVTLMRTSTPLEYCWSENGLRLTIPVNLRTALDDVIAVRS